jgi:hypothetical protein
VSGDPRIYPLPEAIAARRYDIVEGYGTCNNVTGVLSVPLDGSPLSRRVQAHEIAHANWSPTKPKRPSGLPDVAIQRAEDLRMNLLTTRAGAGDALQASLADRDGQDPVRFYLSFARSRLQAYTAACATVGTGDFEPLLAALAAVNPELAAEARYIAESAWVAMDEIDEPSFEDALRLAIKLDQLSESPPPPSRTSPATTTVMTMNLTTTVATLTTTTTLTTTPTLTLTLTTTATNVTNVPTNRASLATTTTTKPRPTRATIRLRPTMATLPTTTLPTTILTATATSPATSRAMPTTLTMAMMTMMPRPTFLPMTVTTMVRLVTRMMA